jgi:lysozyme
MTDKLVQQLAKHEGFVSHAYRDHLGYLTIGYGRLIDEELGGGITEEEAGYLLACDVGKYRQIAKKYDFYDGLNEPRQAVIVNMLFNLGEPRFNKFVNFQAAVKAGDWAEAKVQMLNSRWAAQVSQRAVELARQMETGEWQV